jgi:hypothetical protein
MSCAMIRFAFLFSLFVGSLFVQAGYATDYTEGTDLSNTFSAPTSIGALTAGSNLLTGNAGNGGDIDYVRFDVPASHVLSALNLNTYTSTNGIAFMGIQQGTVFTVSAGAAQAGDLLGYVHYGTDVGNVGTNLLDDMGVAPGAQGFTPPLPAGSYTLWIQNASGVATGYQFNLLASAVVPEPASAGLLLVALLSICGCRRR